MSSTTKHTAEPWRIWHGNERRTRIGNGMTDVAICEDNAPMAKDEHKANASRIVACVNACAGMEDPTRVLLQVRTALRDMIKANEQLMPGVRHIAVQDYALLNDAPILAAHALRALGG